MGHALGAEEKGDSGQASVSPPVKWGSCWHLCHGARLAQRRCPWPVVTVAWSGCGRHLNRGPCCGEGSQDYGVMSPFLPSQPL